MGSLISKRKPICNCGSKSHFEHHYNCSMIKKCSHCKIPLEYVDIGIYQHCYTCPFKNVKNCW